MNNGINAYEKYKTEILPDSLLGAIETIRKSASENYDFETLSSASEILINRHMLRGDYNAGFLCANEFLNTAENSGNTLAIAKAYFQTGRLYYGQGMSWVALDYFLKMLALQLPDDERCRALYAVAESSRTSGGTSKGINPEEYYIMSQQIAERLGYKERIASCLFGRSQMYFDGLEAYKYKSENLSLPKRDSIMHSTALLEDALEYSPNLYITSYAIGLNYAALGNLDKASEHIANGKKSSDGIEDLVPISLNVEAVLNICLENYSQAIILCHTAYNFASQRGKRGDMLNTANIMYYAYKYTGETVMALDALERYDKLNKEMSDRSREQDIAYMQVKFDTGIKETNLLVSQQKNKFYQKILWAAVFFTILILTLSVIIFYWYRKTKLAYRILVRRGQEWAQTNEVFEVKPLLPDIAVEKYNQDECVNNNHVVLMERFHNYISENKLYTDPELTISYAAQCLGTNRTYLSEAINKVSGRNFNQYINEYRIKEAIGIILDSRYDNLTLDAVASEVGFNNRNSFYQNFRKVTNLSPAEFRRNRPQS